MSCADVKVTDPKAVNVIGERKVQLPTAESQITPSGRNVLWGCEIERCGFSTTTLFQLL